MTHHQAKRNFDRWLPHVITIAILAGGGLLSYGSLTEKMNSANEKIEAVKEQNAALWKEVYYLRQRIDGSATRADGPRIQATRIQ